MWKPCGLDQSTLKELGRGYIPSLSSVWSMEIMDGKIWKRIME
jgi:hypothetical protein